MDASHEKFRGLFMGTLKEQLAKVGRSIDYILVSHTEPDHSGVLGAGPFPCSMQHHTLSRMVRPLQGCGTGDGWVATLQHKMMMISVQPCWGSAARPVLLARA